MSMQDQRQESGFTLIEVMVVVAIIGILVAVAVPQYQDYIARSRIVEGMNLSSSAKLAVTEAFASRGTVPMDDATHGSFTFVPTRSVKLIEITPSGAIAIDFQNNVALIRAGRNIEEGNFVSALRIVATGNFNRITRVAQAHKVGSFNDAACRDIQAGNNPFCQH